MEILTIIFLTILGLIFGSFYCCAGIRIPNKISLIKPNSSCPKCKKELKWYMNIPVFSYIFLKGKCAYCKEKINIIYPLVEILTAILFIVDYIVFGFGETFLILIILSSALVITIVTDFLYYYISDRVIVISLIMVLIIKLIYGNIEIFIHTLISATIMFLIMYLIKILGDIMFKKESLGGGDIKLMTLIGASIGIIPSLFSIVISSMIALPFALIVLKFRKESIVPFGPFLILGSILLIYFNDPFNTFLNMIGLVI